MRNRFDRQLTELNNEMIAMGVQISRAINYAINALLSQNTEKAKEAITYDEEIDQKEREIENLCLKLLLSQQPVARDLRQISAALKMITDMERVGDHAADISEIALHLAGEPYISHLGHIEQMAKKTSVMLMDCMQAYVDKDIKKAVEIIRSDDVIDDLFLKVRSELVDLIRADANNADQAEDLLMVAKYFERIGDHATNIAEWVIFSITGEHLKDDEAIRRMEEGTITAGFGD